MTTMISMTKRSEQTLRTRYKEGWTVRDLAAEYDISVTTVLRLLRAKGVKIRPRGPRPG